MDKLKDVLARFVEIDGVVLACVTGTDGLVLDSAGRPGFDAEAAGAVATSALAAAQALAEEITHGRLLQAMAEFEKGVVILEPIGELGVLLVVSDDSSTIGRLRLIARRERPALEAALAA